MASISSIGVGSGLDVESIISQTVELEKSSITTLDAKAEVINTQISTYGEIKSLTDDLNSAARDLTLDRTWDSVKISSSNSSAVNATMTGSAAAGSYNISVSELAQSQTSASTKLAAKANMGTAGVMRVEVGAGDQAKTVDLPVTATDTLTTLAAKINEDPTLSQTLVASVITDSSGNQQLMVRARSTGTDSQFAVEFGASKNADGTLAPVDTSADTGLAKLAGTGGFTVAQEAQNAQITLNGVALESTSNTFADVIPGLSISVSAKGDSLLSLTQDTEAIQTSIQAFVDAYNALNELLSTSTAYESDTGVSGALQGDSSTVSLQNSLRMLTQSVTGNATGAYTRLSDIGIQMQQGGALTLDTTKLATAMNDVAAMKSMFAAKSDALGQGGGIAVNFKTLTDELLAYEGTLNNKTDALEGQLERNRDEVDKVEARAVTVEKRLRSQYSALDVKMASLNSLSSYVEQMVASWNKSDD